MFRGASKVTLDTKGRMAIPSRYRERLFARCKGELIAAVDRAKCLVIYPLPDWEAFEAKIMSLPYFDPEVRILQEVVVGQSGEMTMDTHGRILIPRILRDFAKLKRNAMLLGQGKRFELWDEERWIRRRDEWLAMGEGDGGDLPAELRSLTL